MSKRSRVRVLPGFGLTLGCSIFYLSIIVLIPLSAMFFKAATLPSAEFWRIVTDPRALASYRLTFLTSLASALINAVFGFIVAWVLVRYNFWGKKVVDALVDLPFALPTAVSGITLTSIYAKNGWIGQWLEPMGIQTAYSPLGITIALTFIGLPFVVRSIQPALEDIDAGVEEAALILGATRWYTFRRVTFPLLLPALMTGAAMAFARALGEYGSVIFISGNMPLKTEIASLLIVARLEQFDYAGVTAIGTVMLTASFLMLFAVNSLQWWRRRRMAEGGVR